MSKSQYSAWQLRMLPFLSWKHRVTSDTIRADLISGLTVAIVVVPQAVAFASIAGMPPQYGLYAGMIPPIIAAFFGSSWHLMSGPTTAASIVLLSSLSVYAEPMTPEYVGLALTLTFMVGVIELVLGLARMGTLVNFISHSVVVGFTTGAAILIASKQLKNFFGVPIPRGGNLFETLHHFGHQLPNTNGYVLAIAALTLVSGMVVKKRYPKVPFLIVALLAGSFLGVALNLLFGSDVTAIKTVGALPQTLPPLSAPDFSLDTIQKLAPAALAMTLFALTEAVSIGRAIGIRSGQLVDGNQEFIGQGLSNIAGSFFSGYVATGSFNRTSLNYQAGAKTPMSAMIAGFLEIFIVLAIAPLVAYLPTAAMAGILFIVAWGLIDIPAIKHILASTHSERSIFLVTFLSCLFLDLEFAIMAGILLSLVLYLMRVSKPRILARVPDPSLPNRKFSTGGSNLQRVPAAAHHAHRRVPVLRLGCLRAREIRPPRAAAPGAETSRHRRPGYQLCRHRRRRRAGQRSRAAPRRRRRSVSHQREIRAVGVAGGMRRAGQDQSQPHLPEQIRRAPRHLPESRQIDLPGMHGAHLHRVRDRGVHRHPPGDPRSPARTGSLSGTGAGSGRRSRAGVAVPVPGMAGPSCTV